MIVQKSVWVSQNGIFCQRGATVVANNFGLRERTVCGSFGWEEWNACGSGAENGPFRSEAGGTDGIKQKLLCGVCARVWRQNRTERP